MKASKAKRGTVQVETYRGMLRLRWRFGGKRRSLAFGLPDDDGANRLAAEQLAKRMELDIACGNYDESLDKYRGTQQKNDAAYRKLMAGLRRRLQERFNSADQALLGTIKAYGSPICDRGEAEEFFIWLRDERGLAAIFGDAQHFQAMDQTRPELEGSALTFRYHIS